MAGNYTKVNVILTENQLSKLKHALANDIDVTLRIDSRTVGDGNHELLLTQSQINKLTNAASIYNEYVQIYAARGLKSASISL